MKARIVTARMDEHLIYEIGFIKSFLGLDNTTSVLTHAIHALYTTVSEQQSQKTSFEMFKELGLLGSFEGEPDLSIRYKEEISDIISKKYSRAKLSKKLSKTKTKKRK